MATAIGAILIKLKERLAEILGGQLVGVRLYGSYARREERLGSDIDVLVLVRQFDEYSQLIRQTSAVIADISLRHDVVLSRTFAIDEDYRSQQTPFFMNVRKESVAV